MKSWPLKKRRVIYWADWIYYFFKGVSWQSLNKILLIILIFCLQVLAKAQGKLANVDTLVEPVSKSDYLNNTVAKPPQIFSHIDQRAFVQSLSTDIAKQGWRDEQQMCCTQ